MNFIKRKAYLIFGNFGIMSILTILVGAIAYYTSFHVVSCSTTLIMCPL